MENDVVDNFNTFMQSLFFLGVIIITTLALMGVSDWVAAKIRNR